MFEKTGNYKGVYHVLGGLISPVDDVNPDDINLYTLVNNRITEDVKEVILALNPSVEGETTSLYGADIEYLDPLTIIRAIDDRKILS